MSGGIIPRHLHVAPAERPLPVDDLNGALPVADESIEFLVGQQGSDLEIQVLRRDPETPSGWIHAAAGGRPFNSSGRRRFSFTVSVGIRWILERARTPMRGCRAFMPPVIHNRHRKTRIG